MKKTLLVLLTLMLCASVFGQVQQVKFIELVKKYQTELSQEKDKEESVLDNIPDEYAREAVQRAIDKKIIIGDSLGNLRLHSALTRQDFALILSRLGLI